MLLEIVFTVILGLLLVMFTYFWIRVYVSLKEEDILSELDEDTRESVNEYIMKNKIKE